MKYLWIEDFNGNEQANKGEMVKNIKEQYQLEADIVEIRNTFEDALKIMKVEPFAYDMVLLDINLIDSPDAKKDDNKDRLYKENFEGNITDVFYNNYYEDSRGILLFQYLREVVNIPRSRIAFLSAYVSKESENNGDNPIVIQFSKFAESVTKGLGVEPLAFPKVMEMETGDILSMMRAKEKLKPQKLKVDEPARRKFLDTFSGPNTTDYTQFRRIIIEMSMILSENYTAVNNDGSKDIKKFVHIFESPIFTKKSPEGKKINAKNPGVTVYNPEHFLNLLEKGQKLPFILEKEESDQILTHYLRDLCECGEFFYSYTRGVKDKKVKCELHSARVIRKCRNLLAHASSGNNGSLIREHKALIVVLFFRIVFNIDSMKKTDPEKYKQLEKNFLDDYIDSMKKTDPEKYKNLEIKGTNELLVCCRDVFEKKIKVQNEKKTNKIKKVSVNYSL